MTAIDPDPVSGVSSIVYKLSGPGVFPKHPKDDVFSINERGEVLVQKVSGWFLQLVVAVVVVVLVIVTQEELGRVLQLGGDSFDPAIFVALFHAILAQS